MTFSMQPFLVFLNYINAVFKKTQIIQTEVLPASWFLASSKNESENITIKNHVKRQSHVGVRMMST